MSARMDRFVARQEAVFRKEVSRNRVFLLTVLPFFGGVLLALANWRH